MDSHALRQFTTAEHELRKPNPDERQALAELAQRSHELDQHSDALQVHVDGWEYSGEAIDLEEKDIAARQRAIQQGLRTWTPAVKSVAVPSPACGRGAGGEGNRLVRSGTSPPMRAAEETTSPCPKTATLTLRAAPSPSPGGRGEFICFAHDSTGTQRMTAAKRVKLNPVPVGTKAHGPPTGQVGTAGGHGGPPHPARTGQRPILTPMFARNGAIGRAPAGCQAWHRGGAGQVRQRRVQAEGWGDCDLPRGVEQEERRYAADLRD